MDQLIQVVLSILANIAIVILVSAGLAVVFGFMGVINFAQGQFVMLGAYALLVIERHGAGLLVGVPVAAISTAVIGAVVYQMLVRPLRGRLLETILVTWGLGLVLTQVVILAFGPVSSNIPPPFGALRIGRYSIAWYSIAIIAIAALLMAAIFLLFTRTRFGLQANASIQVPQMAQALGIQTERTNTLTFALGCGLAGFAGAVVAPLYAITPELGDLFTATSYLVVAVGGPLPVTGVVTAGGLLGSAQGVTATVWNSLTGDVVLLVAAMLSLRVFGSGLSANWRRKV